MISTQPNMARIIISFVERAALLRTARQASESSGFCLTPLDRIAITRWQEAARCAGYDRMVIHDRDLGDAQEVGTFLSVHCSGEAWSRWGFARRGVLIHAWCCLSGHDVGEFSSMPEALSAVLLGKPVARREPPIGTARIVMLARPHLQEAGLPDVEQGLQAFGSPLGSAA